MVRSVRHNSHVSFNIVLLSPVAAYLTPEGWRVSYETNSFTLASQSEAYLAPRNKLVHISLLSNQDQHHSLDVKWGRWWLAFRGREALLSLPSNSVAALSRNSAMWFGCGSYYLLCFNYEVRRLWATAHIREWRHRIPSLPSFRMYFASRSKCIFHLVVARPAHWSILILAPVEKVQTSMTTSDYLRCWRSNPVFQSSIIEERVSVNYTTQHRVPILVFEDHAHSHFLVI